VPILATAAGRVAFADALPIRRAVCCCSITGWACSPATHTAGEMPVARDDVVQEGQPLCPGRSPAGAPSGPHFHWEVAVSGQCVDPVQFLQMWMP
jgi:hypothetical protein